LYTNSPRGPKARTAGTAKRCDGGARRTYRVARVRATADGLEGGTYVGKVDLRRERAFLYNPSAKEVQFVEVPTMHCLMVDGTGDPNTSHDYAAAVEALYAVSYALRFVVKRAPGGIDYSVLPLEGLWWTSEPGQVNYDDKSDWHWTMLIAQPEPVTADMVRGALEEVSRKKRLEAVAKVRYEELVEGLAAQVMHIGPYSDEPPTVARLHAAIGAGGYEPTGRHHEVYLGDPRRAEPAKLKTILRQPVRARQ
jgi:hypothetical protein